MKNYALLDALLGVSLLVNIILLVTIFCGNSSDSKRRSTFVHKDDRERLLTTNNYDDDEIQYSTCWKHLNSLMLQKHLTISLLLLSSFVILFCLLPDDFTSQGRAYRRERVTVANDPKVIRNGNLEHLHISHHRGRHPQHFIYG